MSNIVDTVEDRIRNALLTAIDNNVAPKIELAIRSMNASFGRDATANSERGEHVRINALFENTSGNNKILHVSNVNDETPHNIPDDFLAPEAHFNRQAHTHHMVTGQNTQTNQIPEFLIGRILTPRNPTSHHHQNLSTQASQDNNLPMVEKTPRNQNSNANNSIIRLADAVAGIATQQRAQAATMLKPVSTNTLIFDGKKMRNFDSLKTYFTQCSKCSWRSQKP